MRRQHAIEPATAEEIKVNTLPDDLQAAIAANRRTGHTRLLSEADLAALSDEQRMTLGLFLSARESQHQSATDGDAALAQAIARMSEAELAAFDRQQAHQARTPASTRQSTEGVEVHTLPEDLQLAVAIHRSAQDQDPNLNGHDLAALSDEQRMQLGLFLSIQQPQQHVEIDDEEEPAHTIASMSEADPAELDPLPVQAVQTATPRPVVAGVWDGVNFTDLENHLIAAVSAARRQRGSNNTSIELTEADYHAMTREGQQIIEVTAITKREATRPVSQIMPTRVRYLCRLNGIRLDTIAMAVMAEVQQRWLNAVTLLERSESEEIRVEHADQPERESLSIAIPDDFEFGRLSFVSDLTGGGGDSIFHALAGTRLTDNEILAVRKSVAEMRSSGELGKTLGVDQNFLESGKNAALRAALKHTVFREKPLLDKFIPGDKHISDEVYAAFQACPGFHEGYETVAQWTLLEANKGKTVLYLDADKNNATLLRDGRTWKIEMNDGESFQEFVDRHIAEDNRNLVLRCGKGYWHRLEKVNLGRLWEEMVRRTNRRGERH